MPIVVSEKSLRSSIVPELATFENDGSIFNATWTGLSAGTAGTVQAIGFIGDTPNAGTVADRDAYRVEVANGWTLRVGIDANVLGSNALGQSLDPIIRVYDSTGTQVTFNDDGGSSLDSFLTFTNATGVTQQYTIFVADFDFFSTGFPGTFDPFNPNSVTAAGNGTAFSDRGSYRLMVNTFDPGNPAHGQLIQGTDGAEALNGTAGNDVFDAQAGNDTLNGGDGNDLFRWNRTSGNDTIDGGGFQNNALDALGNQNSQAYTVTPNGFGFLLNATDGNGTNTATVSQFIQQLSVHGRAGNDSLTIAGSVGADLSGGTVTFWGDEGVDTLNASGASVRIEAHGGAGDDNLATGSGADRLYGDDGNDIMNGGGGIDEVNYNAFGRDLTINLQTTVAQDTRGAGIDTIVNVENAIGGSGFDIIIGNTGSNYLIGMDGNDVLAGNAGAANTLQGGFGDDRYIVEASGDSITEFFSQGTDTVETTVSSFNLAANVENLTNISTSGADFVGAGNDLANIMIGGLGNDYLIGFGGNDILIDGSGTNTLQGGTGNDKYAVQSLSDSITEFVGEGTDEVQTFLTSYTLRENVENLVFVGNFSHTGVGTVENNRFTGVAANDTFTGAGGNDVYDFRSSSNGIDTITDFDAVNASGGHDFIDLSGRGFNLASLSINASSGGTVIGVPGGDAIFLQGVVTGNIDAGDFLF